MLKRVRESIIESAKEEGKKIIESAEQEVEKLLLDAKISGERKIEEAIREAKKTVEEEKREHLSGARLEAKRLISSAKDDAIRATYDDLIEVIKENLTSKKYAEILNELINKGLQEIGTNCIIYINERDKAIINVKGKDITIKKGNMLGGAIIESNDGKVKFNFTLEALLEEKKDEIRKKIAEKLFG